MSQINRSMSNQFHIDVKVKPYVRQYLINNCGNPADLTLLPKVNEIFKKLIRKPLLRFESLPLPADECYVRIVFSSDMFYRYGWEMTRSGMLQFNNEIERDIKFIMRTYIAQRAALGFTIAKCIRDFQDRFNFPEEVWSFDAIKKDMDRNTDSKRSDDVDNFIKQMDATLHRVFMKNLSCLGTISKKHRNELIKID